MFYTFIALNVTHIDLYRKGHYIWKVDAMVEVSMHELYAMTIAFCYAE